MSNPIEILITLPLPDRLLAQIQQLSENLTIHHYPNLPAAEIPPEVWAQSEVLFTFQAIPTPEQAPKLRWLQYFLAGADRLQNSPLLDQSNLVITTMSGANAGQVAEHILTQMLALSRQLPTLFNLQQQATWMPDRIAAYQPMELTNSTVGIIGYGSIGRQLAYLLKCFNVQVLAIKRDAMHPEQAGYTRNGSGDPEGNLFTRLYPPQAIDAVLKLSDFVVISLPLTEQTKGLINAERLAACKTSAYLIDISRGGVVDHAALLDALQAEQLAGAALDVFPAEPLASDSPLWGLPNVIVTPHIAGFSRHYTARAVELFSHNMQLYLAGQALLNQFDSQKGY